MNQAFVVRQAMAKFSEALFKEKGEFVSFIDLSKTLETVELWPGIRTKWLTEEASGTLNLVKKAGFSVDFDNDALYVAHAEAGSQSPLHYHVCPETLIVVSGKMREVTTGIFLTPAANPFTVPAFTPHSFLYLEPTIFLIKVPKIFLE
jgi:hypothetical protein